MSDAFSIGPCRLYPHVRDGKLTGKWMVGIPATLGGKRVRKLFDNRIGAEEFSRKLDRAYRRGELTPNPEPPPATYSFAELVGKWFEREQDRVETLKKRIASLETDRFRLKNILTFFGKDDISAITEHRLVAFQKARLKNGRKPATINGELVCLFKVLRWAKKKELVQSIPDPVERIPEDPRSPVVPTIDEVTRIIKALPARLQPIVRFMAETGCRRGEAFNLTWDCVDEVHGFVEFRSSDTWKTKTLSSNRRIPVSPAMLEEIRHLPKTCQYVFTARGGGRLTSIRKAFASAVKTASITRNGRPLAVTPHVLRKAYATWAAIQFSVPQAVLQAQLGHAQGSDVTNKYYVRISDEARRQAVISLPL